MNITGSAPGQLITTTSFSGVFYTSNINTKSYDYDLARTSGWLGSINLDASRSWTGETSSISFKF